MSTPDTTIDDDDGDGCSEPDYTSVAEIMALTEVARRQVAASGEEAPVADAYAICAADQVALGDIVQAYNLAVRAADLHEAYAPLRERLYVAEWPRDEDVENDDPRIVAVRDWAANGQQVAALGAAE